MGRWPDGAQERLQRAAVELFSAKGYDHSTVSEIAVRANLTERTFFNYFSDKPQVLFVGQDQFIADVTVAIRTAPAEQSALDTVLAALAADTTWYDSRREIAVRRRQIIDSHAELQEREAAKFAALTTAISRALLGRELSPDGCTLTASVAVAAFQLASHAWLADRLCRPLHHHLEQTAQQLRHSAQQWR